MTDRPATAVPGTAQVAPDRLEPDAIEVTQDTVIGMANAAPSVSVGLTLAGLAAATAYASGPIILLTAVPMLIVANAYRRPGSKLIQPRLSFMSARHWAAAGGPR